jgi:hypothetical protein
MSTIKADTLSNLLGTLSVPVATAVQGSAKAWVNFNGTGTVAIRASFNVSSITDNGTGDYTVNFTTAMQDTNYVPTIAATVPGLWLSQTSPFLGTSGATEVAPTTSSFRMVLVNSAPTALQDAKYVCVSVFR